MTDADLAFKMGRLFNNKITSTFWSSFKGEYGRVQIEVLVYLMEVDSAQASEIASQMNISKQHVSLIIKEFLGVKYVDVFANPNDRRANLISITELGRSYIEKHVEVSNRAFDEIVSKMSDDEKRDFINAMGTIYETLDKF